MKLATAEDFPRPTLTAIRKSLPDDVRHLFLRLMPYSWRAPEEYAMLQTLVHHALANADMARAIEALEQIALLHRNDFGDMPKRDELLLEIASLVRQRTFSPLAAELEFLSRLEACDLCVDEAMLHGEPVGLPTLVGPVQWHHGRLMTGRKVLEPVLETVAALTAMETSALIRMPVRDRRAAIRLIRLYAMFAPPAPKSSVAKTRLDFFLSLGIPVWQTLATHSLGDECEPGIYGDDAIQRLLRHLWHELSASEAVGAESPTHSGQEVRQSRPADHDPIAHTFIRNKIPPSRDSDATALIKEYAALSRPMPMAKLPSPASLEQSLGQLKTEFPWAKDAIENIFQELRARSLFGSVRLGFRPILLQGPGGCGKTRLARRLAEVLGIESFTMSLAGTTDSMAIVGTARGWTGGQPSPLLRPLLKGRATVLYCMDELDKAVDGTRNSPPVTSALLSLIEPEEAKRWRDPFLQVEVDLTPLLWIFTCNSTTTLPRPLLTRLRVLDIEMPSREQMLRVVPFVVQEVEQAWGLPAGAMEGFQMNPSALRGISNMRALNKAVMTALRVWLEGMGPTRH